jgi:RNA polymerase sigma factor (sigma-70 family)
MLLPADQFAARVLLGPALRTQPDKRLVRLVREGHEPAFEEIVRRYRRPLGRFAASIVGAPRAEDVTQDAFSKALPALRRSETEIDLRPWLYRIVRNTAINDLRDGPPATAELPEALAGGPSAATEAERREELADLVGRLQALPETQRTAMVMRELGGFSHEQIGAELGLSGGGARQAIHRARTALRDGFGLLVPLPLLRLLSDHGAEASATGAIGAAGGSAALGGLGGGALKLGAATLLVAGSVGAGVAIHHDRHGREHGTAAAATELRVSGGETVDARRGGEFLTVEPDRGGPGRRAEDHGGSSRDRGEHSARGGGPGPSSPTFSPGSGKGRDDSSGGDDQGEDPGPVGGGTGRDSGSGGEGSGGSGSRSGPDGSSESGGNGADDGDVVRGGSDGGSHHGGGPGPSQAAAGPDAPSSGGGPGDSLGTSGGGGSGRSGGGSSDLQATEPGSTGGGGTSGSGDPGGDSTSGSGGSGGGEADGSTNGDKGDS